MNLKYTLKLLLALGLLALIIYKTGAADVWQQFTLITTGSILFLLYISIVLVFISSLKWKLFLELFSEKVTLLKLFSLYLIGYFVNLLVPSYVGGDAVRSWQIGKKVGQHQALASTVLERYTGIVAMLSMAFAFMWFVNDITIEIKITVFVMTMGLMTVSIFLFSPLLTSFLRKCRVPEKIISHFLKIKEALNLAKSNLSLCTKALLLSYLYHTIAVANVMAAAFAIGWVDVPFFKLFIVLPLVLTIGSLPITPSGLGLQEGAYYFFLQGIGASSSEATAVALVLRAKSYILAVFGGLIWLSRRSTKNH